ncbi:hypothetical protein SAMN05444166_2308 [Singulisphaera sp. GP187]|uniref:hypothetical protein n=1 Tax=Singulisphaera sp. GP187 TaxID=1882752 RepID=UPI00092ADEA4|nr:hypothetical protein [Singulisphaera sp. GP187]SIO07296.1 hypothetical protein SAMN05444166_2308 [Singulisphaera sp. GP187]
MKEFLYVIIDFYGKCWAIREGEAERLPGLPSLLNAGWRPLRETPFPQSEGSDPCILILLEQV